MYNILRVPDKLLGYLSVFSCHETAGVVLALIMVPTWLKYTNCVVLWQHLIEIYSLVTNRRKNGCHATKIGELLSCDCLRAPLLPIIMNSLVT